MQKHTCVTLIDIVLNPVKSQHIFISYLLLCKFILSHDIQNRKNFNKPLRYLSFLFVPLQLYNSNVTKVISEKVVIILTKKYTITSQKSQSLQ